MHIRVIILVAIVTAMLGALISARANPQSPPSASSLEQRLAAQQKVIDQLQTRISVVERRVLNPVARMRPPTIVRGTKGFADMTHALGMLATQHAQFARATGAWPGAGHISLATPSPSDLATEQAKLEKEVSDLKTQLKVDETLLYGYDKLARDNMNTLDQNISDTYADASVAAWLACADGKQPPPMFAGWTPLYGNSPPMCFDSHQ